MGPPERFAEWFRAAGADVRVLRPHLGEPIPHQVDVDALVVMGGQMNALADDDHPWLEDIRRLYRTCVGSGLPVLGICLGAQLLATAFGGEVEISSDRGPEHGLVEVDWTEHADTDPVISGLASPFTACGSHSDGVSALPADSVLLGKGRTYPHQVFRIGSAVGVQFHPETTPTRFRQWCRLEARNDDENQMLADKIREFEERDSEIAQSTKMLADHFLATVNDTTSH
ncbi:type 1 glutamine amidotransferase [Brevibacterium sp. 'Marine']|uniref:type 1 glutamine amidotransferase n=1 Tax=Brevibacterium sp. 'Marine' TaxID=2725563 RepID=UPI00145E1488|nr:type 1 glutamine amidotransferase [Brevibacterium sp. 'Marine']